MWVPQTNFNQFELKTLEKRISEESAFVVTYWFDSSVTGNSTKFENAVQSIATISKTETDSHIKIEPNLNEFDVSLVLKVDSSLKKQAQINLMPGGNKVQIVLKSAQKIPKDFSVILRRVLK